MRPALPVVACLALTLAASTARAGDKYVQNDDFSGSGQVSNAVKFGEYEGAGVLFTPDAADYPLTIKAVDLLVVQVFSGGGIGAYLLDVWDESAAGSISPPSTQNGNVASTGVQLTTSSTQFNRFTLTQPVVVNSGKVFVAIRQQLSSNDDNTTIAMDSGPRVEGANWYYRISGWSAIDGTGAGPNLVDRNWIIRLVLDVPDVPPQVDSISPPEALNTSAVTVTVAGQGFGQSALLHLGQEQLNVLTRTANALTATVPAGMTPGQYDVTVTNPGMGAGTLPNGFRVLGDAQDAGPDAGPPDAGTDAGVDAGSDSGTSGGEDAGGEGLVLESVAPADAWNEEATRLVLLGRGFELEAQVLVGSTVLEPVVRKNAAVLEATLQPGMGSGIYDVVVVNPDGSRAVLEKALTVHQGTHVPTGCGCGSAPLALLTWAVGALGILGLRRRKQRGDVPRR